MNAAGVVGVGSHEELTGPVVKGSTPARPLEFARVDIMLRADLLRAGDFRRSAHCERRPQFRALAC